ncbi:hypothetical protein ACTFIW_006592 [Dictyostelium discoideum]
MTAASFEELDHHQPSKKNCNVSSKNNNNNTNSNSNNQIYEEDSIEFGEDYEHSEEIVPCNNRNNRPYGNFIGNFIGSNYNNNKNNSNNSNNHNNSLKRKKPNQQTQNRPSMSIFNICA